MKTPKSDLYIIERELILNNIFNILNIFQNDLKNDNTFFLHELDYDEKKQNEILELESDIKKYFACGSWACFASDNIKRKSLSIIKNVIKVMNYNMIPKRKLVNNKNDTIYYLYKNN